MAVDEATMEREREQARKRAEKKKKGMKIRIIVSWVGAILSLTLLIVYFTHFGGFCAQPIPQETTEVVTSFQFDTETMILDKMKNE